MGSVNIQSTRSTLTSVDTTLSENITATQNYIPVASTTNFSTSVVAEIESTNEVVSFTDISKNNYIRSEEFDNAGWLKTIALSLQILLQIQMVIIQLMLCLKMLEVEQKMFVKLLIL
jgi:hypothetical protein